MPQSNSMPGSQIRAGTLVRTRLEGIWERAVPSEAKSRSATVLQKISADRAHQ